MLPDGRRLHLQDGPIDLIVEAFGRAAKSRFAYRAACERFVEVLDELCSELSFLRRPAARKQTSERAIARRMVAAVMPYAAQYLHYADGGGGGGGGRGNSGGDGLQRVAFARLRERRWRYRSAFGELWREVCCGNGGAAGSCLAVWDDYDSVQSDPIRGIATSGWRGRSFSLGIADAVTVLADRRRRRTRRRR